MKTSILFITTLFITSTFACPDFSGTYKRDDSEGISVSGEKSVRSATPFGFSLGNTHGTIDNGQEFSVSQNGCESITVSYEDPIYVPSTISKEIVLSGAHVKASFDKEGINYVKNVPYSHRCEMGICVHGKYEKQFSVNKEDGVLKVRSSSWSISFFIFVPDYDTTEFEFSAVAI